MKTVGGCRGGDMHLPSACSIGEVRIRRAILEPHRKSDQRRMPVVLARSGRRPRHLQDLVDIISPTTLTVHNIGIKQRSPPSSRRPRGRGRRPRCPGCWSATIVSATTSRAERPRPGGYPCAGVAALNLTYSMATCFRSTRPGLLTAEPFAAYGHDQSPGGGEQGSRLQGAGADAPVSRHPPRGRPRSSPAPVERPARHATDCPCPPPVLGDAALSRHPGPRLVPYLNEWACPGHGSCARPAAIAWRTPDTEARPGCVPFFISIAAQILARLVDPNSPATATATTLSSGTATPRAGPVQLPPPAPRPRLGHRRLLPAHREWRPDLSPAFVPWGWRLRATHCSPTTATRVLSCTGHGR